MTRTIPDALARRHARELGVDPRAVHDAIQQLKLGPAALARLVEGLTEQSGALTSGSSTIGPETIRLISVLRAHGIDTATPPRCLACQQPRSLRHLVDGGRICGACFNQRNRGLCRECGLDRPIVIRFPDGTVECARCRGPATAEPCTGCGRTLRVAERDAAGRPYCQTCRDRPREPCTGCGRKAFVHRRTPQGPVCPRCYKRPARTCGSCGREAPIMVRARGDQPDLCERCSPRAPRPARPRPPRAPKARPRKGKQAVVALPRRGSRTPPLKRPPKPTPSCALCRDVRKAQAIWPLGPVCHGCYERTLTHPDRCPHCGEQAALIGLVDDQRTCGPCAGSDKDYRCRTCAQACRPYAQGQCPRCHLEGLLDDILPLGPDDHLAPLHAALFGTDSPKAVIHWLHRSRGARLLLELAHTGQPITHELLDEHPQDKPLHYLRALLMTADVLEQRIELLDRQDAWLEQRCAQIPLAHSNLIRPFAQWTLFRRARRRAEAGKFTEGSAKWLRQRVNAAIDFLDFLEQHHASLETADQALLDLYLAAGSTRRTVVRDFARWAHERKLCAKLTVPLRTALNPSAPIDDNVRWIPLRRLLHDDDIKLHVRVAGLFALLYGQHLSRIATWTVDRINVDDDGAVRARLGAYPVALVEPLGALVAELVASTRGKAVVGRDNASKHWLFPGGQPGRPITTEWLRVELANVGIVLRPSRNRALADYATDLPAALVASMLGLHINTAVDWTRRLARDWHSLVIPNP